LAGAPLRPPSLACSLARHARCVLDLLDPRNAGAGAAAKSGRDARRVSACSLARVLGARHARCVLRLLAPPRPGPSTRMAGAFLRPRSFACSPHGTLPASWNCSPLRALGDVPGWPGAFVRVQAHAALGASLPLRAHVTCLPLVALGRARRRIELGRMHPSGAAKSQRQMHAARAKTARDARLAACTGRGSRP
jgi:hypothetical protein